MESACPGAEVVGDDVPGMEVAETELAALGLAVPAGVVTGGIGSGREACAGAKRVRRARSAAVIRVSRGLSNGIHSL